MIVYRDQRSRADPWLLLQPLRSASGRWCTSAPSHDAVVDLVIQIGKLESAVADAAFPHEDGIHPLIQRLRRASIEAGHMLWHSWQESRSETRSWACRLAQTLDGVSAHQLTAQVDISVPEGYAYYAVYPETYIEAARQCHALLSPFVAVCLGLRSIGSSLSAVVAAALEELGCRVESYTLRPRGHPFSRSPNLANDLAERLSAKQKAYFLLVDEGPGISGSSLGGTAALLRSWGVADDHILMFPSWQTDGSQLSSRTAREHWVRHQQFTATFEQVWLDSQRLSRVFPGSLRDLSAGAWRQHAFGPREDFPAVQPQHERRKYLLTPDCGPGEERLLSFAGLGQDTRRRMDRLRRIADAGFTPAPEGLAHGFLLRRFVPGTPLAARDVDAELIERVASYLAHLYREHPSEPTVSDTDLQEMITINVAEGLKNSSADRLVRKQAGGAWLESPTALDGRMLAHEWIRTSQGFVKVDAMDHHEDHFFPGCQDIAWDVAAAAIELELEPAGRHHLIELYRRLSGDGRIAHRIQHYALAYLASRLGYVTLAAEVLGQAPDGRRFSKGARRYARLLRRELRLPSTRSAEWMTPAT